MPFVRTPEEIAAIQAVLAAPRFIAEEALVMEALSTPEFVRSVLPPGIEPADEPSLRFSIGRFRSNCCGDFEGASIAVSARCEGIEAGYVLAMYMNTDRAIIFGREVFGEPKKQAAMTVTRDGLYAHATVERDGARLIEMEADLEPDQGAGHAVNRAFNIKALPAADGRGLEGDAIVTLAEFDNDLAANWPGSGRLWLRGTGQDPLDEIPILEVRRCNLVGGVFKAACRRLTTIPAADFLPYALGRTDDWSRLNTEGDVAPAVAAE